MEAAEPASAGAPPRDDPDSSAATDGLHTVRDPLQVAFRINGERLAVLGWSRAILLQLAHPLMAAGVFDHSGFRASPMAAVGRLYHTTQAMLAITFGDEQRHRAAIERASGGFTRACTVRFPPPWVPSRLERHTPPRIRRSSSGFMPR